MKVILSTGHGRLHLMQSAAVIAPLVDGFRLICGWIPKRTDTIWVKAASFLVGRDLAPGLAKRIVPNCGYGLCTCPMAETLDAILRIGCRVLRKSTHSVSSLGWSIYGFASRKYIHDANIFHVRSGAGQGGAIRRARRCGMKILVDHSALYPAQTEKNLREDYARWNQTIAIAPNLGVWINVERDCRDADMILVNADHIKDSFIAHGYDPNKIRVVYLGVRRDFFGLKYQPEFREARPKEGLKILFTGAFSILKGAEYFLEGLRLLKERGVDYQCDVVGSVAIPNGLRDKYKDLPVVYHGAVPQDELKGYLANADIYLFPSLADGCASSGMEALAAGLCVVATPTSGLPISDGETGYVVPMKDPMAIADKIVWLKDHPDDMERVGKNAANMIAAKYTWEDYAKNVRKVYEELAGEGER